MPAVERPLGEGEADLTDRERETEEEFERRSGDLHDWFFPARGGSSTDWEFEEGRVSPINAKSFAPAPDEEVHRSVRAPMKRHATRSEAAQTADESFNAPLAPSYSHWLAQPNRYDWPMVDTIPPERVQERADDYTNRALEAGIVSEVDRDAEELEDETTYGRFKSDRSVQMSGDRPTGGPVPVSESYGYTLAHEVGHAVDRRAGDRLDNNYAFKGSTEAFGGRSLEEGRESAERRERVHGEDWPSRFSQPMADRETVDELWALSKRGRGGASEANDYRRGASEIIADALALHTIERRAVRREYPRAAGFLDEFEEFAFGYDPDEAEEGGG